MAKTATQPKVKPWQRTTQAVEALGMSRDTLAKLRDEKTLVKGKHWRAVNPTAARLTYQWHVPRIEQLMADVLEA